MAKLWSGLKKRLVVDIGASAVRVCELAKTKTGYEITRFAQSEYNADPSMEEEQRKELRVEALRQAFKAAKFKRGKVILGVPGQSVFTRCRALPPVPEYKVNQIVRYEIQQQIPFGLDQIAMDYQVLSRTEQGGYDVMMAAIKVDVVEKHIEPLTPLKCSVSSVEVLPLAAYNWVKHQKGFGDQGECVALIDIGASTTDIVIERGGQFRFTRPLNLAGNDITKALAGAFNMDFESAERIKRERAFAPTGDPKRDGKGGEVIGRILERLAGEIQRSFSYFRSQPGGGQVNRVLLTGGGARLKNIVPFLRQRLDVDVSIAQMLNDVEIAPAAQSIKDCPEQACDILGMALRTCETVAIDVDLIPPRVLAAARRKEQALYWGLSICALILIFASLVPAEANENAQVLERIEELKQAIRAYDRELAQRIRPGAPVPESELRPQLEARRRQLQNLEDHVNALDIARLTRRFWMDEILLVSDARPPLRQIWFSSVETGQWRDDQPGQQQQRRGDQPGGARQSRRADGFPGIEPPSGVGDRATARGPHRVAGDLFIPRPNSLIVHGFAESDEAIQEFLEELRRVYRQLPNNWFLFVEEMSFSQASVARVPWDVLYDAPLDGTASARTVGPGVPALYSFTVEVRLRRSRERPSVEQQAREGGAT